MEDGKWKMENVKRQKGRMTLKLWELRLGEGQRA